MDPKRWLREHSLKVLGIRDTPYAIAGGVAIGLFFSITPLFGFKTLLTIVCAWLTRTNLVAAFLASASHNIALPFMPLLYRGEYDIGYWLLSNPHHLPPPLMKTPWEGHKFPSWTAIYGVGKYMLLGSFVCATPLALLAFVATKTIVARHHAKHPHPPAVTNPENEAS
jgi:uncharacterized protein (DUF2062 family)